MHTRSKGAVFVPDSDDEGSPKPHIKPTWDGAAACVKDGCKYYHEFVANGEHYKVGDVLSTKRVTRSTSKSSDKGRLLLVDCAWEDQKQKKNIGFRILSTPENAPTGRLPFHGAQELVQLEVGEYEISRLDNAERTKYLIEPYEVYSTRDIFPTHVYYTHSKPHPRAQAIEKFSGTLDADNEEEESVCFTPTKRRRVARVVDSDDEEQGNNKSSPIRRSSRIPELQTKKQYVHNILSTTKECRKNLDTEAEKARETNSSAEEYTTEGAAEENVTDSTDGKTTASVLSDTEGEVPIDLTEDEIPSSVIKDSMNKGKRHRTKDLSWIERMESGLTRPSVTRSGVRKSLEFANPSKSQQLMSDVFSEVHSSRSSPKSLHQPSLRGFIRHVEQREKSGEPEKKNKEKKPNKDGFIPELLFNKEIDPKDHLKRQRLLNATKSSAGSSRRTKVRDSLQSSSMDDSESEKHNSDYEQDDFIVADDAPIEKYTDGDSESESGSIYNEENVADDTDVLMESNLPHTFTIKEAFTVYLQYLVSACVDTDFVNMMRQEPNARRKIRDLVSSRRDSLVRSSSWGKEFKHDLERRPWYRSWSDNMELEDCQACHRSNHPCSYKVCLSGVPYDADSIWNHDLLEPAEQPEDSSERGVKDTIYLLGRFCHSRTQLFHKLHHFPFHLYDKVKRKVQNTSGSPVEITEELMANQAWVSEYIDKFKSLLQQADEFMDESNNE